MLWTPAESLGGTVTGVHGEISLRDASGQQFHHDEGDIGTNPGIIVGDQYYWAGSMSDKIYVANIATGVTKTCFRVASRDYGAANMGYAFTSTAVFVLDMTDLADGNILSKYSFLDGREQKILTVRVKRRPRDLRNMVPRYVAMDENWLASLE